MYADRHGSVMEFKIMRRKLGQHFLKNRLKIKEIVAALELKNGDVVIEIGAGHGELTKELRVTDKGLKIIAIEKDGNLAQSLRDSIKSNGNLVEIIEGDALKLLPRLILKLPNYKIVGNIPYYITGRLLRIIGELHQKPKIIVLTVQKEVAERIIAKAPRMNLLAASVQIWAKAEIIGYISKREFQPIPKVDSAIVRLKLITLTSRSADECYKIDLVYYKTLKILFKQPRKTVLNNLNAFFRKKEMIIGVLEKNNVDPNARPQNLGLETIKNLAEMLYN